MPNWNFTDYVAKGDRKELEDLASKLNSLFFKKPLRDSDFGTHWLVNVHALFDESFTVEKLMDHTLSHGNLRGCIIIPCAYDRDGRSRELTDDEKRNCFRVENDMLRFSIRCAYCNSFRIEIDICDKYPSIRLHYKSETEMYDDGCVYDPDGDAGFSLFDFCDGVTEVFKGEIGARIRFKEYQKKDLPQLLEDLHKWGPQLNIPENADFKYFNSEEFAKDFLKERKRLMNAGVDAEYATFRSYEEVI